MPIRVFMVTGTLYGSAARTADVRTPSSSRVFHGGAAPPPLRVTFGTGQPKLSATWATPYSAHTMRTASPMYVGSTPYSWTERTVSFSANASIARLCGSPSTKPREVIISHTYNPAPCSAHRVRKAAFVTPAMGARTTGTLISSEPRRNGRATVPVLLSVSVVNVVISAIMTQRLHRSWLPCGRPFYSVRREPASKPARYPIRPAL